MKVSILMMVVLIISFIHSDAAKGLGERCKFNYECDSRNCLPPPNTGEGWDYFAFTCQNEEYRK